METTKYTKHTKGTVGLHSFRVLRVFRGLSLSYVGYQMKTTFLNPPGLCPTFGWTQVVCHTGGKTIYISGQTAVDAQGQVVGKGDLRVQAERAWECVGVALKAAGATFQDLVK